MKLETFKKALEAINVPFSMWLANFYDDKNNQLMDENFSDFIGRQSSLKDCLYGAFSWECTPQGENFWLDAASEIEKYEKSKV